MSIITILILEMNTNIIKYPKQLFISETFVTLKLRIYSLKLHIPAHTLLLR